jgi:hypothetical protein
MWAPPDVLVDCHLDVVDGLNHALEGEVVDDAHGNPHGWSVKKILMSATVRNDVLDEQGCRWRRLIV